MQQKKHKKEKLPKRNPLKQFQEIIIVLISTTVAITTIANNIHNIFK